MNVRKEIEAFSAEEDKPVLRWLFDRYSLASQWRFVACCAFERYGVLSYQVNRTWSPTKEGHALFHSFTGMGEK